MSLMRDNGHVIESEMSGVRCACAAEVIWRRCFRGRVSRRLRHCSNR